MRFVLGVMSLLLILAFYSFNSVDGYTGSLGDVYIEIIQDGRITPTQDHENFFKEIDEYVKNYTPINMQERQLLEKIVKHKNTLAEVWKKIDDRKQSEILLIENMESTKAKKEFQKIKNKIVLGNHLIYNYNYDLPIQTLKYAINLDNPRLIEMGVDSVIKKYKHFATFNEDDFIKEVKELKQNIKEKGFVDKFVSKSENKITKIKKDWNKTKQNHSSSKCHDDNGNRINCGDKNKAKPPKADKPDPDPPKNDPPKNDPPKKKDPKPPKKDKKSSKKDNQKKDKKSKK